MNSAEQFPRLHELGVSVFLHSAGIWYVERDRLKEKLGDRWGAYCGLFGIQTQFAEGPYAHDAEAVLERIATGKLQGSQLHWD